MDINWYVQLVEHKSRKLYRELGPCVNEDAARKVVDDVMTWLNVDKFFLRVVSREEDESVRRKSLETF
jgi:hypothetical protein